MKKKINNNTMGFEGPLSHMNYVFLNLSESHDSLIIVSKFNENTMSLLWTVLLKLGIGIYSTYKRIQTQATFFDLNGTLNFCDEAQTNDQRNDSKQFKSGFCATQVALVSLKWLLCHPSIIA